MSLDLYVELPGCEHCKRGASTVLEWSYTYNVTRMLEAAAGAARVEGYDGRMLAGIEGRAGDYVAKLDAIVTAFAAEPERYRAMNPSNGWGSYETLLPRLRELLGALRAYPDATVRASR